MQEPILLHSTEKWWVVSKPSGWLTVPGRPTSDNRVQPVVSEWMNSRQGPAWTVHRLDRETSGVLLFAKSEKDHREANLWFQNRKVKKIYHCLSSGAPVRPVFKINQPIDSAPSLTQVEVQKKFHNVFLARVFPQTGRTHQIRIHLASLGFPILGDFKYGGSREILLPSGKITIDRVALHASRLELPTGEKFEAPFPEEFQGWLNQLEESKR